MTKTKRPRPVVTERELRRANGLSPQLADLVAIIRDAVALLRRELARAR